MHGEKCVGAIVCKLDMHKNMIRRGYIAMLAVQKEYRRHKIGKCTLYLLYGLSTHNEILVPANVSLVKCMRFSFSYYLDLPMMF